jgi:aromatase
MAAQSLRDVEHEITVAAPGKSVYQLIADVAAWPMIFPPTIYVDHLEQGADSERIRIWATANGELKSWTSRRTLDPGTMQIGFRQEKSASPVAAMGGTWLIEPLDASSARIRLLHEYRAVDDDPESLAWIDKAVDANSRTELAALKQNVELAHGTPERTFSFEDSVCVEGALKDVYDFINQADRWSERLPHVAEVQLTESQPGLQTLTMNTRAKDGSTHSTKSFRVCLPERKIAYKQVTLPALMSLHTGYWTFAERDGAVVASSQHTVVLNEDNIPRILGDQATVADAREYVTGALSTNSRATLDRAKQFAEGRRR